MVEAGEFRADLLNRLTGHRVELPPLRARREDLGLLLAAHLQRADPALARDIQIHPRAVRALLMHPWPGNVRELEKAVAAALVLARQEPAIDVRHLPEAVQHGLDETAAAAHDAEERLREELLALLRQHGGNVAAVARAKGKARMQIQRWLKRFGIDPESFRP
jgi:transcriptional regulator with PAS, ATPase and Fis domain